MKRSGAFATSVFLAASAAMAAGPGTVCFRIASATNSGVIGFSRPAGLTWTNAAVALGYSTEWSFDLRDSNGWELVAYGQVTSTVMNAAAFWASTPRPPKNRTALVPAGVFDMGNAFTNLSTPDEVPVHPVQTRAFYIDKFEVSRAQWDEVRLWGLTNGYTDLAGGSGTDTNHPVGVVSWYDCVKWCNARSEREGLTPVYCTEGGRTNLYRAGSLDLSNAWVRWDANGYRLPTEAEWEKAARGPLSGQHFPWPSAGTNWADFIGGSNANYRASGDPYETGIPGAVETTPVGYYNGGQVIGGVTQAIDMANGYGIYDMAGNVTEWCWDWYNSAYYSAYPTNGWPADPLGPETGVYRALRGAAYSIQPGGLRCANRFDVYPPSSSSAAFGFRCVRGL